MWNVIELIYFDETFYGILWSLLIEIKHYGRFHDCTEIIMKKITLL